MTSFLSIFTHDWWKYLEHSVHWTYLLGWVAGSCNVRQTQFEKSVGGSGCGGGKGCWDCYYCCIWDFGYCGIYKLFSWSSRSIRACEFPMLVASVWLLTMVLADFLGALYFFFYWWSLSCRIRSNTSLWPMKNNRTFSFMISVMSHRTEFPAIFSSYPK